MIYSLGYSQVESLNLVSRFLLFECFKPVAFMIKSEGYGNPVTRIKRWLESTSRTAHFINDYFLILQTISIFNESLINLNQFWPKPIECLRYRPTYRPYKMQKPLQSTKIWKYIQFYFLLHFVSLINTRKRISNESMIRSRSGIHETGWCIGERLSTLKRGWLFFGGLLYSLVSGGWSQPQIDASQDRKMKNLELKRTNHFSATGTKSRNFWKSLTYLNRPARGSSFKALSYLHRQVYPMAEFKRSNLDNLMTSDPTDGVMSYIYAHARPHSQKPIFNT